MTPDGRGMAETADRQLRGFPSRVTCTLLLATLIGGCSSAAHIPSPRDTTPLTLLSVDQAIAAVRQRDAAVQTMRARFEATVQLAADERRASGVVVVKKPDRLRLQLLSPFGLTVMDYASIGGTARLQLPLDGKVLVGEEIEHSTSFSPTALAPAFLSAHQPIVATCVVDRTEAYADCSQQEAATRRSLRVGLHQPVVQRETFIDGEGETLRLEYSDYRSVDGVLMPFRIEVTPHGEELRLRIDITTYELNPALADSLFEPSDRAR